MIKRGHLVGEGVVFFRLFVGISKIISLLQVCFLLLLFVGRGRSQAWNVAFINLMFILHFYTSPKETSLSQKIFIIKMNMQHTTWLLKNWRVVWLVVGLALLLYFSRFYYNVFALVFVFLYIVFECLAGCLGFFLFFHKIFI